MQGTRNQQAGPTHTAATSRKICWLECGIHAAMHKQNSAAWRSGKLAQRRYNTCSSKAIQQAPPAACQPALATAQQALLAGRHPALPAAQQQARQRAQAQRRGRTPEHQA